jgi:hypothetical protein
VVREIAIKPARALFVHARGRDDYGIIIVIMQNAIAEPALQITVRVLREGDAFIAHATELDVSSHGVSLEDAVVHLREAIAAFLGEAARMGTLEAVLRDAGYVRTPNGWTAPTVIAQDRIVIPLPA